MTKSTVLRMGFGGMIVLLIVSALEGYRIQESASRRTAEIYHRYGQQSEQLFQIRRLMLLGSIYTRDFLLSTRPDRAAAFRNQLHGLEVEAKTAIDQLRGTANRHESFRRLESNVGEFWRVLETPLGWTDETRRQRAFDFVESEVAPRRSAARDLLVELTTLNDNALKSNEAELAASRRGMMLRVLAILGACLLLGVVVAHLSLSHAERLERESIERFEEVVQAKKDLQQLSARLLEIQEEERKRLSRELHDEIGQTLTALRIEISRALAAWKTGSPETETRLKQAHLLAEKTVQTVRDISLLLRPSLLDDLGLGPALQWHAEEFRRRSGIRCSLSEEGLEEQLPEDYKTCIYRIVQEALNNCEKHAGATYVRLTVRQTKENLSLEIEDNGRGFEMDKAGGPVGARGLGILGVKERVAALGGIVKLESAKGQGTRLHLSLPLMHNESQS